MHLQGFLFAEVYRKFQIKILVCAVKRGKEIYIPDGNFVLEKGDKMHIVAAHQNLKSFFRALGHRNAKVKSIDLWRWTCMLLSGNAVAAGRHAGKNHRTEYKEM